MTSSEDSGLPTSVGTPTVSTTSKISAAITLVTALIPLGKSLFSLIKGVVKPKKKV